MVYYYRCVLFTCVRVCVRALFTACITHFRQSLSVGFIWGTGAHYLEVECTRGEDAHSFPAGQVSVHETERLSGSL